MTLLEKTTVATAIVASNIVKSYQVGDDSVEILHGVSLEVVTGEMVAVMGASGSGKSTLMYCLAGLEEPTSGTVRIGNQPLSKLSRSELAVIRRSDVGFVFQSYNLMPTLPAAHNVALPSLLRGERVDRARVEEALAAASTLEKPMREQLKTGANRDAATAVGKLVAERAIAAGVKEVVFDRGPYLYHGRVKALADGAREGGLSF